MNTDRIVISIREAIENSIASRPYRPCSHLLNTTKAPAKRHRKHLYLDVSSINDAAKAMLKMHEGSLQPFIDQLFSWPIESIITTLENCLRTALRTLYFSHKNIPCYDMRLVKEDYEEAFNLAVIDALVENQLLSPLYAMSYIAFYRDTKRLRRLCNSYPENALSLISETEFDLFHQEIRQVIADVIISNPDSFSNLFAYLRAPVPLTSTQYLFILDTCLRIDQEMTLHHLSRITTFSQTDIKQVADCVFANASPIRVIQNLPECIRPFALKLMGKGL